MVSDFTLSRQRENIAGLEVVRGPLFVTKRGHFVHQRRQDASMPGGEKLFLGYAPVTQADGMSAFRPDKLEGLAAAESSFEVMPPFELITFVRLPTEEHDAAVTHRREIDQSL